MKHIKTFEVYNKTNIDYDKIYMMNIHTDKNKLCKLIGKFVHWDYGIIIKGYVNNVEISKYINGRKGHWRRIREATPEEINHYNMMIKAEKYNL